MGGKPKIKTTKNMREKTWYEGKYEKKKTKNENSLPFLAPYPPLS